MEYYVLFIWEGVDPAIYGPFQDIESRDNKAIELRERYGSECGYFPVQANKNSKIEIGSFTADFFED